MLQYAVNKSFEEMQTVIELAEKDLNSRELDEEIKESLKKEVNFRIGTFLHWLFDYHARLEKNIKKDDKPFFSGLKYVNNMLKHDINVIQIYEYTGGLTFPVAFPMVIKKMTFRWRAFYGEDKKRNRNQHNNYDDYIKNREVLPILKKALEILEKCK